MKTIFFKLMVLALGILVLQSCYTLLRPPATLPHTVTTVTSAPAIASSLGGSGYYGWDPYWEPALPFTSYHRGYGASYYNPYNYYDYRDPYYAPIYVVSESVTPTPGRKYGRDDRQGGGRERDPNTSPSMSSGAGKGAGSSSSTGSMAPPKSVISAPVAPPAKAVIVKPLIPKNIKSKQPNREVKPAKKEYVRPPKKRNDSSSDDQKPSGKRVRTRD